MAAATLFAVVLALLAQSAWVPDGRHLMAAYQRGHWWGHNVAYLPLAHLLGALVAPVGVRDPGQVLSLLSAVSGGVALWAVLRAGWILGLRGVDRWLVGFLSVTTPAALFYGTAVEVHAVQLAASALAVMLAARSVRERRTGTTVALPALMLFLLVTSHLSGLVWIPALAVLYWPARGWRALPLGDVLLAAALLAGLASWLWASRSHTSTGVDLAGFALRSLFSGLSAESLWREFLRPLAGVAFVVAAALVLAARRRPPVTRAAVAVLLLVLGAAPFAAGLGVHDRGGYYLSLHPVLAVAGAVALLGSSGAAGRWLVLAAVLVQAGVGWADIRRWERDYPGHEWVASLLGEQGDLGVAVTADPDEWRAIALHSRWTVLCPQFGDARLDLDDPRLCELGLRVLANGARRGQPLIVTRAFWESGDASVAAFRERLVERFGPPRGKEGGAYLVFPLPQARLAWNGPR